MSICTASKGELVCVLRSGHDGDHSDLDGKPFRVPLVHRPLNAEEAARLNPDLTPKYRSSPLEVEADRIAAGGTPMSDPITDKNAVPSFVPPKLKVAASILAAVGGVALLALPVLPTAVPVWVGTAVFVVTAISGFLAGLAMPAFAPSKPLLPLALVPAALSLAGFLTAFAANLQPGVGQSVVLLVAALLGALAGKAVPQPKV